MKHLRVLPVPLLISLLLIALGALFVMNAPEARTTDLGDGNAAVAQMFEKYMSKYGCWHQWELRRYGAGLQPWLGAGWPQTAILLIFASL